MSNIHVLLLQGSVGSGPWHWQQWLHTRLRELGTSVDLARVPELDGAALTALRAWLTGVPREAELVVVTHSHGAALWLHHAASLPEHARAADRALLVAPQPCAAYPGGGWDSAWDALDVPTTRRAAGITRLVVGTGDPQLSLNRAHAFAASLGVEMDVVLEGGHLNTESGYGPWPAVLRWVLYGSTPVEDRLAPALARAEPDVRKVRRFQL